MSQNNHDKHCSECPGSFIEQAFSDKRSCRITPMCHLSRYIPALVLIILYALIVLTPLAPLALRSATIANVITGECAGDCAICGCSPERSGSHTCCCWQKKLQQVHEDHDDDQNEPDCCKKIHAEQKNKTVSFSSRPCGSNKSMAFPGVEQTDVFPFRFNQRRLIVWESTLIVSPPVCRADWPGEPPDPPPKLPNVS
jgi:hypothetical protein